MSWYHICLGVSYPLHSLPFPSLPRPAFITPTAAETKTLSTFGNLIENKSRKTEGGEEGKKRERKLKLTRREGFDRFTHYVANIYGTTNRLGARVAGGSTGLQWLREGLRTGFRVVARASSTARRVVKFEFATAKWATSHAPSKRSKVAVR